MIRRNQLYAAVSAMLALAFVSGCGASRKASKVITVAPDRQILSQDSTDKVSLNLVFQVPEKYFSTRSRLIILPQLMVGDTVKDKYSPIVLDAPIYNKKKERLEVLEEYQDPYSESAVAVRKPSRAFNIPYSETVSLPEGLDNARIAGVVTADGCGKCANIDTVDMASIANPVTLIDVKKSLELSWIEPEFVIRPKVMEGRGVANLQFIINKFDINLGLGNNRAELEDMVSKLSPILDDTLATLTSLGIYGMASADGSLPFNTALARNRAESAKKWLVETLDINPETQRIITVGSRPEGWLPVLAAMTADGNPDSLAVRNILDQYAEYDDDVQERHIRRLSCWRQIREKYLQKDRKVEYVFTYTIKSFTTDEELLEMYGKRPDAFNEDELLRVAVLASTPEEKKSVYETILKYFPQSQVAANNLAVLYLRDGNEDKAREILSSLEEYSEETLNTLAASYVYSGDYERAIELLQDVELPQARYNLGLLKARQRRFQEAYELLLPFGDVNSAVCALSTNRNREAMEIMDSCDDLRPVAEYVHSMAAARLGEASAFFMHIEKACVDSKLRERAQTEPDFDKYRSGEQFVNAVNR